MFHLQYSTGGELPIALRSPWNNFDMLNNMAKKYLEGLTEKAEEHAKSSSNKAV